jgi:hypothetical protein
MCKTSVPFGPFEDSVRIRSNQIIYKTQLVVCPELSGAYFFAIVVAATKNLKPCGAKKWPAHRGRAQECPKIRVVSTVRRRIPADLLVYPEIKRSPASLGLRVRERKSAWNLASLVQPVKGSKCLARDWGVAIEHSNAIN